MKTSYETVLADRLLNLRRATFLSVYTWPFRAVFFRFSDLGIRRMTLQYVCHVIGTYQIVAEVSGEYARTSAFERRCGGVMRWEKAHGVPLPTAEKHAVCQWCGETVYSVEFNPRHEDSAREAAAICHGLVAYHLMNSCERRP